MTQIRPKSPRCALMTDYDLQWPKDTFLEQCNIASFTIPREPSQYRVLCNIANMTDLTAKTALEHGPAARRRAPHTGPPPDTPFYKSILRHDCWSHLDGFGLTPLRWRAVGPERQRVSACMAMASPPTPYNFPQWPFFCDIVFSISQQPRIGSSPNFYSTTPMTTPLHHPSFVKFKWAVHEKLFWIHFPNWFI